MGREIELKIPLTDLQYDYLFEIFVSQSKKINDIKITKNCILSDGSFEQVIKKDEYWSKYNSREERVTNKESQVIRIRTEETTDKNESFFTLKHKTKQNGIELNQEDETFVKDPEVLRLFFVEAGYHKWFEKVKKNYSIYCTFEQIPDITYHVELEEVNGLKYLETEVTQNEGDASVIKESLAELMKVCGLNPENRDIRSWVEILGCK